MLRINRSKAPIYGKDASVQRPQNFRFREYMGFYAQKALRSFKILTPLRNAFCISLSALANPANKAPLRCIG